MLTDEQRRAFDDDGFVALAGRGDADDVARMRERIWRRLEHNGAVRADPTTWRPHQANGLRPVSRSDPDPRDPPVFVGALDDLFGAGVWRTPGNWGQVLVTFPTAGAMGRPAPAVAPRPPLPTAARRARSPASTCSCSSTTSSRGAVARSSCAARRGTSSGSSQRARPATRTQKQWRTAFDASHSVVHGAQRPHGHRGSRPALHDGHRHRRHPHPGRGAHGPRRRRRGVPPVADPQHRPQRARPAPDDAGQPRLPHRRARGARQDRRPRLSSAAAASDRADAARAWSGARRHALAPPPAPPAAAGAGCGRRSSPPPAPAPTRFSMSWRTSRVRSIAVHPDHHPVADRHGRGRLGRAPVDAHVPAAARVGGLAAGLEAAAPPTATGRPVRVLGHRTSSRSSGPGNRTTTRASAEHPLQRRPPRSATCVGALGADVLEQLEHDLAGLALRPAADDAPVDPHRGPAVAVGVEDP